MIEVSFNIVSPVVNSYGKLIVQQSMEYQMHTFVGMVFKRPGKPLDGWRIFCSTENDPCSFLVESIKPGPTITFSNGSSIKSQFRTIVIKPFVRNLVELSTHQVAV